MRMVLKLGLATLLAGLAIGQAEAAFSPANPALNTVETTRFIITPVDRLRGGRMRLTLGIGRDRYYGRDHYRYRSSRHWRYLRGSSLDPFWDRPSYRRGWPARPFYRDDPWFEPGSRLWRGRYGRTPSRLRLEWRQELRPRSLRMYPDHQTQAAHRAWCHQNYRSYRASDNSFQPYRGGRQRCRSPYGR
ncbi:BA14K family protein [Nitratireductor soli]|uniref:BA14K family protein n=1 Tax=Nitratireductor soli TaxID=1670619 RepID=UPI000AC8D08E